MWQWLAAAHPSFAPHALSRPATNCCFRADAQHNSYWGEHKYTGPATARGKIWAGVGGRPPLMVEVCGYDYGHIFLV